MSGYVLLILVLAGLGGLWAGSKWVVRGALGVSQRLKWSHSFVGLIVLAVGTDLPELFVSVDASLRHLEGVESSGIITGNAIGSCISQISVILGISAFFIAFQTSRGELVRNGAALLLSAGLLGWVGWDGVVSRGDGVILLATYLAYFLWVMKFSEAHEAERQAEVIDESMTRSVLWLVLGFVLLGFASHVTVDSAMKLADRWGIEQSFMGIAFLGLGTSLPELAVSVQAARKKATRLSIGNILGSNVFDALVPVGAAGAISSVNMERAMITFDLVWLAAISAASVLFMVTRRGLSRMEGGLLIGAYLFYLYFKMPF